MASTINASNSTTSGLIYSADDSGTLQLQTNGIAALTIDTNQNISFAKSFTANSVTISSTINKVTLTAPATGSTLTITNGKTLSVSNTLTLTGTDASSVAFGTGGTVVYSGGALGTPSSGTISSCTGLPVSTGISGLGTNVATFLSNPTSANLAAALTDETGTGVNVFATSPTLITPILGVATATSINKVALTAPATGSTLTITDGKTLTVSNTVTVTGTDSTSYNLDALTQIPQNAKSISYTTVLDDAGKAIVETGSATTITIPANGTVAYPVGTSLTFVNNTAGNISIAITTDTMYLAGSATTGTRTLAQRGVATAYKVTSTVWFIAGGGLT